ncbi:MAG: hypothetical protein QOI54_3362 [Actinomycetota bacterium]|jgi:hypothetical protein|nr:hypothetical protein [Actinomycetota bacterium]
MTRVGGMGPRTRRCLVLCALALLVLVVVVGSVV